jgi:hypothetical protein
VPVAPPSGASSDPPGSSPTRPSSLELLLWLYA